MSASLHTVEDWLEGLIQSCNQKKTPTIPLRRWSWPLEILGQVRKRPGQHGKLTWLLAGVDHLRHLRRKRSVVFVLKKRLVPLGGLRKLASEGNGVLQDHLPEVEKQVRKAGAGKAPDLVRPRSESSGKLAQPRLD